MQRGRGAGARAFSSRPRQTYLSSGAGEGTGISGSANGSSLTHVILQPEGGRAVSSKVFVRHPRLAEVLGALQHHSGRPGRLEDQNQVSEVEGGFQVQPDGFARSILGRLPPSAGQAERGIGHSCWGVSQPRVGPAAPAAGGELAAALGVLGVGAEEFGGMAPAGRLRPQRPPVGQVAHPGVAGFFTGAARSHCAAQTCKAESKGGGGLKPAPELGTLHPVDTLFRDAAPAETACRRNPPSPGGLWSSAHL